MSSSYLPLHWESTGNKWWYASPIDLAASCGHYDLVRELLHFDMNLLIKLTSLCRIRRLEALWDDETHFVHASKCRSFVARNLLLECERKNNKNSLIRAGYGGWLMYTACSAGDNGFIRELLERDPLLVFGEGEYGVADILYGAARSKNKEVFKTIFELAIAPRCLVGEVGGSEEDLEGERDNISVFRSEIVNRAALAVARGGNLEVLKELIEDSSDVLAYRDNEGATILHASAGRGQIEVVNYLVETFNIIECRDNQGNTALHIAAFRAHFRIAEALISASSPLPYLTNNGGDTFIHAAVAGFQQPGFRRLDRQMHLIRHLIAGNIVNIPEIVNMQNNSGRTALHVAVVGTLHADLVELLMTVPSVDINIQDVGGLTPLDLLCQRVSSAASSLLIKKFVFAGGKANLNLNRSTANSAISPQLKVRSCSGNSPGTSFRIADSEIFSYTGIEASASSEKLSSTSTEESEHQTIKKKAPSSLNAAAKRIRNLLRFPHHKQKNDHGGFHDYNTGRRREREEIPTPLRQAFSGDKRTLSTRTSIPSPATRKKFSASLMHGVFRSMPLIASFSKPQSPVSPFSCSQVSSPVSEKTKDRYTDNEAVGNCGDSFCLNTSVYNHGAKSSSQRSGFMNVKSMDK